MDYSRLNQQQFKALQRQNKHQDAIRAAQRASKIIPDAPEPHTIMGRSLGLLGLLDEAIAELNLACEMTAPENRLEALRDRAWLNSRAGRALQEIDDLSEMLRIAPQFHPARARRANLRANQHDFQGAIDDANKIIQRKGSSPTTHNMLGHINRALAFDCMYEQDDRTNAQAHMRKAILHLEIAAEAEQPHPQSLQAFIETTNCLIALGLDED